MIKVSRNRFKIQERDITSRAVAAREIMLGLTLNADRSRRFFEMQFLAGDLESFTASEMTLVEFLKV